MKSAYEKYVIARAEQESKTFKQTVTKIDIQDVIADILWDDLLVSGIYVWKLLEATGDTNYDENSFKKAAALVMDDSFSLINLESTFP